MCVLTEKNFVLSLRNLALLFSQLCYSGTNCFLTLHSLAEMESKLCGGKSTPCGGYSKISNFVVNHVLGNGGLSVAIQENCSVTACLFF